MLTPGWGTGTRGGSPPGVKLCSLPVMVIRKIRQDGWSWFGNGGMGTAKLILLNS